MTRPSMKWGVPYEGLRINAGITIAFTIIVVRNPTGFLIGIGIHMAMRELAREHPFIFHKLNLWSRTKLKSTTAFLWGGSRLQPTPHRPQPTEIRSCV